MRSFRKFNLLSKDERKSFCKLKLIKQSQQEPRAEPQDCQQESYRIKTGTDIFLCFPAGKKEKKIPMHKTGDFPKFNPIKIPLIDEKY